GVYWKPVWAVLEDRFELMLVNARAVKQVPGRKTDIKDAQWLCQLLEAGLLRASLVPPKPIRTLRKLTPDRKATIQDRNRERASHFLCKRCDYGNSYSFVCQCVTVTFQ